MFASLAIAAAATIVAASAPALATGRAGVVPPKAFGADASGRFEVRAALNGAGLASGKASYKERTRGALLEQRFSVEVEDATPGDALAVAINGTTFGTIVVNELGVAEMELRNITNDPGVGPLPPGFPRIMVGDTITVGSLSGTFAAR